MNYEIDFLPVGDESKGGDAICFRYWDAMTPQFVGVIDGGTLAAGEALVEHIKKFYQTNTVDVVINTHPHRDHTAGLWAVLEQLNVRLLMMHKPWEHSSAIEHLFHDGRVTSNSISERVKEALQSAHDLYNLAIRKGVQVAEPFSGVMTPSPHLSILGPSLDYYRELLLDFTCTPEPAKSLAEQLLQRISGAAQWVQESWYAERLLDPVVGTNSENNSSVVSLLTFGEERSLFTADAGVPALEKACDFAESHGIPLKAFRLVQIPHHGSKRNVGPTVLNRLIGPIKVEGQRTFQAIASVPKKGDPKHPSRRVTNAFNRRGASVAVTKGQTINYPGGMTTPRPGWNAVPAVPMQSEVEDDERD